MWWFRQFSQFFKIDHYEKGNPKILEWSNKIFKKWAAYVVYGVFYGHFDHLEAFGPTFQVRGLLAVKIWRWTRAEKCTPGGSKLSQGVFSEKYIPLGKNWIFAERYALFGGFGVFSFLPWKWGLTRREFGPLNAAQNWLGLCPVLGHFEIFISKWLKWRFLISGFVEKSKMCLFWLKMGQKFTFFKKWLFGFLRLVSL